MKEQLAQIIRDLNLKGWSPATSTNYSFKDDQGQLWVSKSGRDKAYFEAEDFMTITDEGKGMGAYETVKPSDETLIHIKIYALFPETKVVLHSHAEGPVVLSMLESEQVAFQGFEVQKGFKGQTSHEDQIQIPIIENAQDMILFQSWMEERKNEFQHHCFIIKGHGTYAWGNSLFEAKRHLETLDYLCSCKLALKKIK